MNRRRAYVRFDEVKAKIPLPEVLEKFGIKDQFVKESKNRWTGPCPLPSHPQVPEPARSGHERNTEQFKIEAKLKGDHAVWMWYCHAADHRTGGDVIEFVKEMLQDSGYDLVREWFGREFGEVLNTSKPRDRRPHSDEHRSGTKPEQVEPPVKTSEVNDEKSETQAIKPLSFQLKLAGCEYLQDRRISPETADRFGAGLCRKGHFKDYLVFPIYRFPRASVDEHPVSYVGRLPRDDVEPGTPRWRQFKDFAMSRHLFALNEAVVDTNDDQPIIVVEGALDVLVCFEQGIKGVAAPIGAYLSDEQIALLQAAGRSKIGLMFDGDGGGRSATREVLPRVARHFWTRYIPLPDGQDPADLGSELRDIVLPMLEDHAHGSVFTASQEALVAMAQHCWIRIAPDPLWS